MPSSGSVFGRRQHHEHGSEVSTVKSAPTGGKARAAVKAEVLSLTPEEKKKLKESNLGAQ